MSFDLDVCYEKNQDIKNIDNQESLGTSDTEHYD